ncbi:MAG: SDR family oxidoreductase [Gammaproteobacteria bacterium]|nr:SDR family oxidoreductase [Gammaproteobacteria bacterium]
MTTEALPDMTGKTVLITGATSGIGLEAAVMLAGAGARLIIVGRNVAKTGIVLAEVAQRSESKHINSMLCDFASQAAIHRLADQFIARHQRLDILINNAGTVNAHRRLTEDGVETTFAVNHLGYFLLTNLLLDRIKASAPARIVNVASQAHYQGTLDLNDPGFEHGYRIMHAYRRSKLANVLFTRELARRLEGSDVTVNAVHPGVVATHIWDGAPRWTQPIFAVTKKFFMISPEAGAKTIVYLAASPEVEGKSGLYFENNQPKEPSRLARDEALGETLWIESERLTHFPSP